MKSINIKDVEVRLSLPSILNAISTKSTITIDIDGNIYINETVDNSIPIIFQSQDFEKNDIMDSSVIVKQFFKEYKISITGAHCVLKPLIAWQHIIGLNKDRMLYFDHQSDGIELFEDKVLEDMGWEATALDINYREIAEHIESNSEGFLVYYDNGVQFNGFAIVNDIKHVRNSVKYFITEKIKIKIKEGSLDIEDDDVQDALSFFEIEV